MAKYRLLTSDELANLEKDFIDYLVLNGITADEWVKIKKEDEEKAQGIIDLFSDVVFEKIMRKTKYISITTQSSIKAFKCDEDEIHLAGLDDISGLVDFNKSKDISSLIKENLSSLKGYRLSKKYNTQREIEIFKMLDSGCSIDDEERLYVMLDSIIPK